MNFFNSSESTSDIYVSVTIVLNITFVNFYLMNKKICQDDFEIHWQKQVFQKNLSQTLATTYWFLTPQLIICYP